MKPISNTRIFGSALAFGVVLVLCLAAYERVNEPAVAPASATAHEPLAVMALTDSVSVSEQISLPQVADARVSGFATIIDMRPDGEVEGQPPAATVKLSADANKLAFAYVPVPQGDIPDSTVDALTKAIADSPKPVLLYCRSGRRAARTWALVEASRPGGKSAEEILAAVKESGQSADDLAAAIAARIAKRASVGEVAA